LPELVPVTPPLVRTAQVWEVIVPHLGGVAEEADTLVVVGEVGAQEVVDLASVELAPQRFTL